MKVKLQKIIDALYDVNDDNVLYLDTEAGETVLVYDGGVYSGGDGVEDMTPDEVDESERFIFLPSSCTFLMVSFITARIMFSQQ